MKQYKYFHHPTIGYVDVISENDNERKQALLEIFSKLKQFKAPSNVTAFTYGKMQDDIFLMQATNMNYSYFHGYAGKVGEIDFLPTAYIGRFTQTYSEADLQMKLEDATVPRGIEANFYLANNLQSVFADMVENILYGDKPIIIVGDNQEQLEKYIKVLLLLFPKQYAINLGFSTITSSIPDFIFKNNQESLNIKIVGVTFDASNTYSQLAYVYNVSSKYSFSSYKNESLHLYSQAIREISDRLLRGDGGRVASLINLVCGAFLPDGTVDEKNLERVLAIHAYESNPTYETALKLLKMKLNNEDFSVNEQTLASAIKVILDNKNKTMDAINVVKTIRNLNESINFISRNFYGEYLFTEYFVNSKELQDEDKIELITFISDDNNQEFRNRLLQLPKTKKVVSILMLAYLETESDELLRIILNCIDLDKTYNSPEFENCLLEYIAKIVPEKDLIRAISILVTPCYYPKYGLNSYMVTSRLQELVKFLASLPKKTVYDEIRVILQLKNYVVMNAEVVDVDVLGAEDFDLLPETYIDSLVKQMSFDECLSLINRRTDINIEGYTRLHSYVNDRLSNITEVEHAITLNNVNAYREFLERTPNPGKLYKIKEFLNRFEDEANLNQTMQDFRYDFIRASYHTLSKPHQQEIEQLLVNQKYTGTVDNYLKDTSIDYLKKQEVIEKISQYVYNSRKVKKVKGFIIDNKYIFKIGCFSFLYMLLAIILLVFPALFIAVIHNFSVFEYIIGYVETYFVFIPLYVWLLFNILYFINIIKTKLARKDSLKNASYNTFLFGILPLILYSIVYIVLYFLA